MTLLGMAGMSTKGTVAGGVSKTVGGLRAGGVSGRPWLGSERRGGGVRVRRGGWEVGDKAAKIALRVLIAESWILCLREVERVVLMVSWPGEWAGVMERLLGEF